MARGTRPNYGPSRAERPFRLTARERATFVRDMGRMLLDDRKRFGVPVPLVLVSRGVIRILPER